MGGLIYFSHNIQDEAQLTEMLQNTQNFQGPMFLGIDEEGGIVSRIADSGLAENVGSMAKVGEAGGFGSGERKKQCHCGVSCGLWI